MRRAAYGGIRRSTGACNDRGQRSQANNLGYGGSVMNQDYEFLYRKPALPESEQQHFNRKLLIWLGVGLSVVALIVWAALSAGGASSGSSSGGNGMYSAGDVRACSDVQTVIGEDYEHLAADDGVLMQAKHEATTQKLVSDIQTLSSDATLDAGYTGVSAPPYDVNQGKERVMNDCTAVNNGQVMP